VARPMVTWQAAFLAIADRRFADDAETEEEVDDNM